MVSIGGDGRRIAPWKGELPLFGRRIAIRPYKCATTPLEGIFHGIVPYLVLGSLIRLYGAACSNHSIVVIEVFSKKGFKTFFVEHLKGLLA